MRKSHRKDCTMNIFNCKKVAIIFFSFSLIWSINTFVEAAPARDSYDRTVHQETVSTDKKNDEVQKETLDNKKESNTEPEEPEENPKITENEIAPGLTEKIYKYKSDDGPVTVYFIEADKNSYYIKSALDRDLIPGRQITSDITKSHNAVAGINASYFAANGEIIGVMKLDGKIVGTTYYERASIGVMPDGSLHFGKINYQGYVTLNGVTESVSGVNCFRDKDCLIIYNKFYGDTTKTNEYGMEYTVQNGVVTAINKSNSPIPPDGVVISVHGKAMEAFKNIMVGDTADVFETLGEPWDSCKEILGAGPRLIENGQVHVTSKEEDFPANISFGRAPRTGFGVTKEGNYLFAVADGRQKDHSIGCTLTEFAKIMLSFGAVDALNFDGGGSSTMVLKGNLVNSPSDGQERAVASALLLMERE
ncbi:MAG: phosphodiester glycosidase family protein [Selenomonadaceae bacterium]|nr:phosphodiester glycosidase family protein [Selenomonadaceae bacterium]